MKKMITKFRRMISAVMIALMVVSLMPHGFIPASAAQDPVEVSTLVELENALANADASTEIVVSNAIELTTGTDLNGNGATVRVATPYIGVDGKVLGSGYSTTGVFTVSSGNVVIRNMTVMGGFTDNNSAAIYQSGGTFKLYNVTLTRSNRGICVNNGKCLMSGCSIVRNVCGYAGGALISSGATMVMDGCSLSENRTTQNNGGGGAVEVNGKYYANNTIISNNCGNECGGAINDYFGNCYLMNCTITGNIGKYGSNMGAAIRGTKAPYAVNCIIADNYNAVSGMVKMDIGGTPYLYNCVYGAVNNAEHVDSSCKTAGDSNVAAGYRTDSILKLTNEYSDPFSHPALVSKTGGGLYVPVSASGIAASGGVDTYFDYSDLNDIKMGYGDSSSIQQISNISIATAANKVTTYFEGGTRQHGVIGASGTTDGTFYTVTLEKDFTGGSVTSATIYGDTYLSGTSVIVTAVPDVGKKFEKWTIQSGSNSTESTDNPYIFTVDKDVKLTPSFIDLPAAAVGDTEYQTLDGAVAAWNANGGTLKLLQDAEAATTLSLTETGDKTLDLNGYTWTGPASEALFDLSANGSLTIKDEATGGGGNIKTTGTAVTAGSGATVTLESGTVESTGGKAFGVEAGTNVNLLGGSVKTADGQYAIDNGNITLGGNIDIDGGGIFLPDGKQIHLENGFAPASPVKLSVANDYDGSFLDDDCVNFFHGEINNLEEAFAPAQSGQGLDFNNAGMPIVVKGCTTYGGITVDGKPLNSLNIERLLGIAPENVTYNSGTLTINGNVTIPADNTNTLDVPAGVTIVIPSGKTLTNNGTISGEGKIQVGGTLVNNGALGVAETEISSGGALTNNNDGSVSGPVTNGGGTITNAGTISGNVNNNSGTLENTGMLSGEVSNQNGGTLNNNDGGNITGTVTNAGDFANAGTIKGNAAVTNSGTMTNSGTINGNASVNNSGTLTNNGTIGGAASVTNSGTGNITNGGTIGGAASVTNSGTGNITNDGNINTTGTVTNGSGATITNEAGKTINSPVDNSGTIINRGTLAGTVANKGAGEITNNGTISGDLSSTGAGSKVTNEVGGTLSGNVANTNGSVLINKGNINGTGKTVNNSGTLTNDGGITSSGGVNNTGTLTNNEGKTIVAPVNNSENGTVTNNGTLSGAVTNSGNGSTINNETTGTISGKLTNSDNGIINNEGTISGDLTSSGNGSNVNNALGGKLTGNVTNNTGSTLTNNGEINGDGKTFDNSGILENAAGKTISVPVKNTNGGIVNNNGTLSGDLTNTGSGSTVNNNSGASLSGKVTNGNGGIINNKANITNAVTNQTGAVIDNMSDGTISGDVDNKGVIIKDGGNTSGTVTNKGTAAVITPAAGGVTVSDGKITMPAGTRIETPASGVGTNTVTLPTIGDATFTVPFAEVNKLSVDADGTTTLPAGSSIMKDSVKTELPYGGSIKQDGTITVKEAPPAPPTPPSGGGGGSTGGGSGGTESYTIPVTNENTVNVKTEITDGTAVVGEITQKDIDKIVDTGSSSGSGSENTSITIDISQAKSNVTSVELTKGTIEKLAEAVGANDNIKSVEIKMSDATVELDGTALSAVSGQAEGRSIRLVVDNTQVTDLNKAQQESLEQFDFVSPFEAYFESDGKRIHDFKGGEARVSIRFTPEEGRDVRGYQVCYVPDTGLLERYPTSYEEGRDVRGYQVAYVPDTGLLERYLTSHEEGWLSFVTSHFSDYAVIYDESLIEEPVAPIEMHRLYNPNSGEHFYTADTDERDHLVEVGWNYEGVAWIAPEYSEIPVYRLYNANVGDHHYTISAEERDDLVAEGWRDEGIGWYSVETEDVPLYRVYNPNALEAGAHHYTADVDERDYLVVVGWSAEGIGWYGMNEEAKELMK